jgi:hypothetical protein
MDPLDVSARVEGLRPGLESPYKMFEMIGSDEFPLFSTDYPHWDFDSAHHVFPSSFPKDLRQKILADNARGSTTSRGRPCSATLCAEGKSWNRRPCLPSRSEGGALP